MAKQIGNRAASITLFMAGLCFCTATAFGQMDTSGLSNPYAMPATPLEQPDQPPTIDPGATLTPLGGGSMSGEPDPGQRRRPLPTSADSSEVMTSVDMSGDEPPPFGGGGDVDDSGVPVDGGLSLLLATGLGLGGRALLRRHQAKPKLA